MGFRGEGYKVFLFYEKEFLLIWKRLVVFHNNINLDHASCLRQGPARGLVYSVNLLYREYSQEIYAKIGVRVTVYRQH